MAKPTTVRFTDEVYQRLDQASARTGMPVNSIVVAACLEWMQRHTPMPGIQPWVPPPSGLPGPPRWSTIRRAMRMAVAGSPTAGMYPFERFSDLAKKMLTAAQREAQKAGLSYIGTEHLLVACFADEDFQSARILRTLGVEESAVRSSIAEAIGTAMPKRLAHIVPTSRVKRVIEMAFNVCTTMNHPLVGTGHVLLALAAEGEGIAAHVLKDLGATPELIDSEMRKLPDLES